MATGRSWQRLIELLEPIHRQAASTARRLSRTRADGDDLFQEAVVRAYEKLPSLREASRFRSWFYAVLLTVHRNRARRGFWRRFLPLAPREDGLEIDPAGEDGAEWEERRRAGERVSRALACLPAAQREAVVLFEIDGFSVEEVAVMQKTSMSAVKSRLARGRRRLRAHYEALGFGASRGGPERDGSEFGPAAGRDPAPPRSAVEAAERGGSRRPIPEGETS